MLGNLSYEENNEELPTVCPLWFHPNYASVEKVLKSSPNPRHEIYLLKSAVYSSTLLLALSGIQA
jgi:hypothetical protein